MIVQPSLLKEWCLLDPGLGSDNRTRRPSRPAAAPQERRLFGLETKKPVARRFKRPTSPCHMTLGVFNGKTFPWNKSESLFLNSGSTTKPQDRM